MTTAAPYQEVTRSAGDDGAVVRTIGLTKRFGRRVAVNALNLEVYQGDVYGLLGPNGSGKTTTLRMLLGLARPSAGQISLFGHTMHGHTAAAALQHIGAVVEQPAFYPYLSGRENLRGAAVYGGMPYSRATSARIEETLALVGLAERARDPYRTYSLGMKQRLGVAAALLSRPQLVLLDEPTNGLDPAGMVEVRALISQLAREGITVLLSSHLLHEVQQVCTRVGVLKNGVLLAQGAVEELLAAQRGIELGFADPNDLMRAIAILKDATEASPWLRGARYVPPEPGAWVPPGGWLLLVDAPVEHAHDLNALLGGQGIYAAEVHRRDASLEQYFLELTSPTGANAGTTTGGKESSAPIPMTAPSISSADGGVA